MGRSCKKTTMLWLISLLSMDVYAKHSKHPGRKTNWGSFHARIIKLSARRYNTSGVFSSIMPVSQDCFQADLFLKCVAAYSFYCTQSATPRCLVSIPFCFLLSQPPAFSTAQFLSSQAEMFHKCTQTNNELNTNNLASVPYLDDCVTHTMWATFVGCDNISCLLAALTGRVKSSSNHLCWMTHSL